jgi:hypothetical protein
VKLNRRFDRHRERMADERTRGGRPCWCWRTACIGSGLIVIANDAAGQTEPFSPPQETEADHDESRVAAEPTASPGSMRFSFMGCECPKALCRPIHLPVCSRIHAERITDVASQGPLVTPTLIHRRFAAPGIRRGSSAR